MVPTSLKGRALMMRHFLLLVLLHFFSFPATGETQTLKLVTGEYAPYSGQNLPNGGVSTHVVQAIFKEIKQDIKIEFIPWNRAMHYLKSGSVAGSFPWAKNAEREKELLFSNPVHEYKILSYLTRRSALDKKFSLSNKKACLAIGWDISLFEKVFEKNKISLDRPITMESCFQMLAMGRIDLVVVNEHVGNAMVKKLFSFNSPVMGVAIDTLNISGALYFTVPKNYPNGKKIISEFNRGLRLLKKNGKYDLLVQDLEKRESAISSDELYNHLGSL